MDTGETLIGVLCFLAVLCICGCIVVWRALTVLQHSLGTAVRRKDRSDIRLLNMISRTIDRFDTSPDFKLEVAQMHAQERQSEVQSANSVEREKIKQGGKQEPPSIFNAMHGSNMG